MSVMSVNLSYPLNSVVGMTYYKGRMVNRVDLPTLRANDALPRMDTPLFLADKVRFVKVLKGEKKPFEAGWNKNTYAYDNQVIQDWVDDGNNYGVMPIKDVIIIDCDNDDTERFIPPECRNTYRVQGRGKHYYFECHDSPPTKASFKDNYGDIRGAGSPFQVVGAGSIHPTTNRHYAVIDATATLITVTWNQVLEWFKDILLPVKQPAVYTPKNGSLSKSDKIGLTMEKLLGIPRRAVVRGDEVYLDNPMEPSSKGNLNMCYNTRKNTWICLEHRRGGDCISWIHYAHCGGSEGDSPRTDKEMKAVMEYLRNNGYRDAIDVLEREEQRAYARAQPLQTFTDDRNTTKTIAQVKADYLSKKKKI